MSKLLVKNGIVYDPFSKVEGEVKDILIENGKIVEKFTTEKDVEKIDAKNKTIIPSALDIHTHIASYQLNLARLLGTKNPRFQDYWSGLRLPNIAKDYLSQGYTFLLEANVFPSFAKQTIFDLSNLPVLDKAFLLNISNMWPLELEYQKGLYKDGALFVSDLLEKLKGFGIKVYNPFEAENWNWASLRDALTEKGRLYNFNPLDVYLNITKIVEFLTLPHSVHAHIEGYESPLAKDNLLAVLKSVGELELKEPSFTNSQRKRTQIFHLAHASSYNIDGNNAELIKLFNSDKRFDLDLGFIGFNPINPLLTSDRRLINSYSSLNNKEPIIRTSLESEGDAFIALRAFERNNQIHCNMWGNALEIALSIKNKWQVQFSVNYPIYGDIKNSPEIYGWLMSKKLRTKFMKDMNPDFLKNHPIVNSTEEYSFMDVITITRASPAKSLGLEEYKGQLGTGADGDLNILNININEIDESKDIERITQAFKTIEVVIKNGQIVKNKENFSFDNQGKIFWSKGHRDLPVSETVIRKKNEFYEKYYSVFYDAFETTIKKEILREV